MLRSIALDFLMFDKQDIFKDITNWVINEFIKRIFIALDKLFNVETKIFLSQDFLFDDVFYLAIS